MLNLHNYYRNKVATGNEKQGNPGPQPAAAPGAMKTLVRRKYFNLIF